MKVLVTGATGFLGTSLCAYLEERGCAVTRLGSRDCDLTRQDSLLPWSERPFDQIYHLAAWTQAGTFCLHHPGEQWVINQQINTHVLAWWQKYQSEAKLICIGTSCAYAPDLELVEENYLAGQPIESLFTYAMAKRMLYAGLLALNKQFGLRYLHVVPSTLYGPGYHTDGRQMHFIFDLIRKILRGKLYDEPVVLWGNGYQRRELIYIGDFVRIAVDLAGRLDNETVNIGAGEDFTIREFARMICEEVGYDFERIGFDTSGYVGVQAKLLSIEKLKTLVPDLRLTPLRSGLRETIDWFRREQERVLPPAEARPAPA
jgi:GDP-L-fucose synthase